MSNTTIFIVERVDVFDITTGLIYADHLGTYDTATPVETMRGALTFAHKQGELLADAANVAGYPPLHVITDRMQSYRNQMSAAKGNSAFRHKWELPDGTKHMLITPIRRMTDTERDLLAKGQSIDTDEAAHAQAAQALRSLKGD